ncbi:MAG: HIT domain-containing protein [Acidimicrobiia bacterium]|nr:HIT domain-containing protein [Acidimicrobiia bacterium]
MLDHLWAGWRSTYVKSIEDAADEACLFCRLPDEPDEDALIIERSPLAYSVLNRYPYTTGHLMVTTNRHLSAMAELTSEERSEMWDLVIRAETALTVAMRPAGFNLGANLGRVAGAGIPDHVHFHLVPRWAGDANFMTTTGGTRVLPESLEDTWANVRAVLEPRT